MTLNKKMIDIEADNDCLFLKDNMIHAVVQEEQFIIPLCSVKRIFLLTTDTGPLKDDTGLAIEANNSTVVLIMSEHKCFSSFLFDQIGKFLPIDFQKIAEASVCTENKIFKLYANESLMDQSDNYDEDDMFQVLYEEIISLDQYYPFRYLVAKSKNYYLEGQFETVCLFSRKDRSEITIVGDFYGDCSGGVIDWNERFCVTVGCGYIVYYLKDPFEPYSYNRDNDQWKEYYRDGERWYESVRQINDYQVELIDEFGQTEIITIMKDSENE